MTVVASAAAAHWGTVVPAFVPGMSLGSCHTALITDFSVRGSRKIGGVPSCPAAQERLLTPERLVIALKGQHNPMGLAQQVVELQLQLCTHVAEGYSMCCH